MLTNEEGETTSHIQGMFNRTIRFITEGLRPVFVFDGKPPSFKSGELLKRKEKREKAQQELQQATEEGNVDEVNKQSKRLVRAGKKENEDCIKLLQLMGVPVVMAPCEAEAQAATLARNGQVYAVGTEDMDALTFQTPILLRKMTFANASKSMIQTMNYAKAIQGLEITHDQFVDLCILLGCDYCDTIRGVGPKTALKLIREYGYIEKILQNLDRKKYTVPENWEPVIHTKSKKRKSAEEDDENNNTDDEQLNNDKENDNDNENDNENENDKKDEEEETPELPAYVQARSLFNNHEVIEKVDNLQWKPPQAEELTKFLVDDMGFNAERVKSSIEKLQKALSANSKPQSRMDSFFKVVPSANASMLAKKRKQAAAAKQHKNKKGKKATGRLNR